MNRIHAKLDHYDRQITFANSAAPIRAMRSLVWSCLVLFAIAAPSFYARAQTVSLNPTNNNLFVGANFSGSYTNFQFRAVVSNLGGVPVTLSVPTPPAGVTVGFSTNDFTNSINVSLLVMVTNVVKGVYPLEIDASGGATGSTTINLIAGTLYTNQNAADVNWSTVANWSAGAPSAGDNVMFQDAGLNTNNVDTSVTVDSLTYLRNLTALAQNTTIGPGATLSVTGTNGFAINVDSVTANNKTTTVNFWGDGNLVVSNENGNFTINSDNTGANATIVTMSNLANMKVIVSRFGLGDVTLANQGGVGAQNVIVSLPKTNYIQAGFTNDLTATNTLVFALSMLHDADAFNNGSANTINLGFTNALIADNMAFGQSRVGSSANTVRFNPGFTNGIAASLFMRNTNGGRISLIAIGVDSGTSAPGSNARGTLFLNNGLVDILADTMWLGRDRNSAATNNGALASGALTFGPGKVDVNLMRLGYQEFVNNSWAQGTVTVNSNGTLIVNNTLEFGFVAGDYTGGSQAAQTFGRLNITGGGVVRASQVVVQPGSTNNQIVMSPNSLLVVSNTLGSPGTGLTVLSMDAASLTLFVTAGVTNAYVTNLTTTVNSSKINIASVSGFSSFPATNVLIAYQTAASHNLGIGTLPAGFNNMQINDNTANKTIELIINTNQPKTLAWRGGQDSNWNHTSLNWLDTNTLAITKFTDGDSVIFDDTPSVPVNITLAETILPGQNGTGIYVSNSVNNFTFSSGSGSIGNAVLVKDGTGSLQIDGTTSAAAQINAGTITGSGTIASASIAAAGTLNFAGTVSGGFVCAGIGTISGGGVVAGPMTIQSGGIATNAGTIQGGALTLQSGSQMYNSGALNNIGAATVAATATLINAGTIGSGSTPNSLTVNGTFKDMGLGNITVDSLTINGGGTFMPGGDGIGTTTVISTGNGSFPGLVRLLQNSTNIFKVDFNNPQTNTLVLAERFVFGPSQTTKANNGCTVVMNNVGIPPFSAGQNLKLFGYSGGPGNFFDAGLNTTNSYPVMQPTTPGPGLAWDALSQVIPTGIIRVVGVNTTPTNLVFSTSFGFVVNTNGAGSTNAVILSHLQWPSDYTGWRLQQQITTVEIGLTTNWSDIFASTLTNDMVITNTVTTNGAAFYRMTYP
jgi:hypothetical protein